ncbi:MAG: allophanate hydrolase [Burkholderiales bacterium]
MKYDLPNLSIGALRAQYLAGELTPRNLIEKLLPALEHADANPIWINRLDRASLFAYADALASKNPANLPLYGIPFAVKDNIDLIDTVTTAGCPAYAYQPAQNAHVVQRLIDAGAIPIGKTNLDQFATGLVGTRSPYGACRNVFNSSYISGGSSSGSAVAVASGLISFSLGTDTAGSGRVPAAFNNLVGVKPTLGLISTSGVVPACRTLDCVSIFALTVADAADVLNVAAHYDDSNAYSRAALPSKATVPDGAAFRFGVPSPALLEYFGNSAGPERFAAAVTGMQALGGIPVEIDFAPFLEAACLLYEGPWVAERYAAISEFIEKQPEALLPVLQEIIGNAKQINAIDAFKAQYRLQALKRSTEKVWDSCDVILTPTAAKMLTIAEVEADPIRLNSNLGYYTNFMNLLNLSAIALPGGFQVDGHPFGVTLFAPEFCENLLLGLAARLHRITSSVVGATPYGLPQCDREPVYAGATATVDIAVCGAHMSGLPLNHQLTNAGARFKSRTVTAPVYQFYVLPGGPPQRPGMVRTDRRTGAAIELEIWSIPVTAYGKFVDGIPAPLGIGRVQLSDGSQVQGFVCETAGIADAIDITAFGGWRAYLASR